MVLIRTGPGIRVLPDEIKVGFATPETLWTLTRDEKHQLLQDVYDSGADHVFMADHVSFRNGHGTDGFIEIAGLSQLHDHLGVMISIYLLPLRHPMPVARQLATMQELAPGRTMFGVGIGGDDRHEVEVCGVDPSTRGRRMDEALDILRQLRPGQPVDYDGEFFKLEQAVIRPALGDDIPVIVGGRSNAALVRTGRYGDGWVGAWCSVRRFQAAVQIVNDSAAAAGRNKSDWLHGYQSWVSVADSRDEARELVANAMEAFYKVPFEQFERYVPYGTPEDVADALAPYTESGCGLFNLKVVSGSDSDSIAATGIISRKLRGA